MLVCWPTKVFSCCSEKMLNLLWYATIYSLEDKNLVTLSSPNSVSQASTYEMLCCPILSRDLQFYKSKPGSIKCKWKARFHLRVPQYLSLLHGINKNQWCVLRRKISSLHGKYMLARPCFWAEDLDSQVVM